MAILNGFGSLYNGPQLGQIEMDHAAQEDVASYITREAMSRARFEAQHQQRFEVEFMKAQVGAAGIASSMKGAIQTPDPRLLLL